MNAPTDDNPYAPPTAADIPPAPPEVAFIQKNHLVVPAGWQSPPVCILTGKTVDLRPHRKTFFWASPARMSIISIFLLYYFFKDPSTAHFLILIFLLLLFISRKRDFVNFYLSKPAEKIHKIKQIFYWTAAAAIIAFYALSYRDPYAFIIFTSGMGILGFFRMWTFRIANVHWRRLWLGGVPHEVMKTIVRMDEERAAAQETPFPAPRLNFKS